MERLADSIVRIHAYISPFSMIEPYQRTPAKKGVGTGFFLPSPRTNMVLTCAHVVEQAHRVAVVLPTSSGGEIAARVKLIVPDYDLAIIQINIDDDKIETRPIPLVIGDSDALRPGAHLFAIGFPLGQAGFKVTDGVFSGHEGDKL